MTKEQYIEIKNLSISENLYRFVNNEILPGTKISSSSFWSNFSVAAHELAKKNKDLLEIREELQIKIDTYNKKNKGKEFKVKEYEKFLYQIGYIKKKVRILKLELKMLMKKFQKSVDLN